MDLFDALEEHIAARRENLGLPAEMDEMNRDGWSFKGRLIKNFIPEPFRRDVEVEDLPVIADYWDDRGNRKYAQLARQLHKMLTQ